MNNEVKIINISDFQLLLIIMYDFSNNKFLNLKLCKWKTNQIALMRKIVK